MPDTFTVKGREWIAGFSNSFTTQIGDTYIQIVAHGGYEWFINCPGANVSERLPGEHSPESAASQAFDICHLKVSNLANAFSDSLVRERKMWFESLEVERDSEGVYKACPCRTILPLDASQEVIDSHYQHRSRDVQS